MRTSQTQRILLSVALGIMVICACDRGERKVPSKEGVALQHQSRDRAVTEGMNAKILRDEVSDTPLKTQVTLDVVLTGATTREQLETLLQNLYNEVSAREGFKYSKRPTHIGIYVYPTEAHALSGEGQWIGMISRTGAGATPDMRIEDELLKHQSDSPIEKFGLTEQKRQEIWQEIVRAEDKARDENDKARRKRALADKYGLTLDELSEIGTEGSIKNWPFPELEE